MSNMSLIPSEEIIERLRYENPWWVTTRFELLSFFKQHVSLT